MRSTWRDACANAILRLPGGDEQEPVLPRHRHVENAGKLVPEGTKNGAVALAYRHLPVGVARGIEADELAEQRGSGYQAHLPERTR
jgi:hypothetical protein